MPRDDSGVAAPAVPPSFELFGVTIHRTSLAAAVDELTSAVFYQRPMTAQFVNAHCLNVASENRAYRRVLAGSDRVYADGSGIHLACRLLGLPTPENVNGTDMLPLLCKRAAGCGIRLYFLGGRPGIADAAAKAMEARYPGLEVAGSAHGHVGDGDDEAVCAAINDSGADIVLVGMGVPRQELWIARNRQRLSAAVVVGVGGLFDFYSGRIPRAPKWLRRTGGEWIWRLMQEPARMWRRYVIGNPLFVLRVLDERRRRRDAARKCADRIDRFGSPFALRLARIRFHLDRVLWRAAVGLALGAKRGLDLSVSVTMLAALLPLLLSVAAAIRLESPGPALFRQTRVGLHGRLFTVWKFRSMYKDAEARRAALVAANEVEGGVLFKMKRDPRITRIGRFIRKASIDELPQLWNVLIGDMSLVGPRPPLPSEVAQYTPTDRRRLDGVPGITCTWQVSGRSNIPFKRQVALDVEYIESQSPWRDFVLLLKTIPAVLTGRGAM